MISRRIFLKNGGLALVSLGFAPTFLARTAAAAEREAARADHHLPARRGRRAEHGRAVRRARLLPRAAEHRDWPARLGQRRRARPRRVLRPASAPVAAEAALGRTTTGDRARLRIAGHDALALRRAGLHGVCDAGREEHAGRLAQPLPACARASEGDAVPGGRAGAAAAALAAGARAGARDRLRSIASASAPARTARWCSRRSRANTARPPTAC